MTGFLGCSRRFLSDEDGATVAEYVLMAALIAVACLTAVTSFGDAVAGLFRRALEGLG